MLPILSAKNMQAWDSHTMLSKGISSLELMEQASEALFQDCLKRLSPAAQLLIFAGPGNNGGDALAVARKLIASEFTVKIIIPDCVQRFSSDNESNQQRLANYQIDMLSVDDCKALLAITHKDAVIIDGLFGTGLNRPPSPEFVAIISAINDFPGTVISIDIASGLMSEPTSAPANSIVAVKPDVTLCLQTPMLTQLLPSYAAFTGKLAILDIGLAPEFLSTADAPERLANLLQLEDFLPEQRKLFSHKGLFGHVLLVAGSATMPGAAILASGAALRSGAGLVSCCSDSKVQQALIAQFPEAMLCSDAPSDLNLATYSVIAIGPGLGTTDRAQNKLESCLQHAAMSQQPVVIDADAITLLAKYKDCKAMLGEHCILTPHPKEFVRLVGDFQNEHEKLSKLRKFCQQYKCFMILKGAYSILCEPNGEWSISPIANPMLATAGSGDVLTGILAAKIASSKDIKQAAIQAMLIHGMSASYWQQQGCQKLIASDLIAALKFIA